MKLINLLIPMFLISCAPKSKTIIHNVPTTITNEPCLWPSEADELTAELVDVMWLVVENEKKISNLKSNKKNYEKKAEQLEAERKALAEWEIYLRTELSKPECK